MSLLWWMTTLGMCGCSFLRRKRRRLRDLVLRLRNERHGDAIRAIRSDNGSEFRNSRFEILFHDLGLEHQFLSPYMPPQNGIVEKKNRSLCEITTRNYLICDVTILSRIKLNSSQINICDDLHFRGGMSIIH
jgi:transposase InsO family protein